jgi:phosphoglycerate kinase
VNEIDLGNLKSSDDADVRGKRVLVRADLNVPAKGGKVTDATRIERSLPTVKGLTERGARVIILSHFGRPDGKRVPEMSLKLVADKLSSLLGGRKVAFADDCVGPTAEAASKALKDGDILVLENTRFHAGEEENGIEFVKALAKSGDLFVNDAFSCAHRAHASTEGLAHVLPAYAGPQMMAEIGALRSALEKPQRPVAAIVGGAKISTKISVLTNLSRAVDKLIIGGGMANTFFAAEGVPIGKSLAERDQVATVKEIAAAAKGAGCEIVLPVDGIVAKELKAGAPSEARDLASIAADDMILDIGPKSVARFLEVLTACRTVLWNGPLGAFEVAPFGEGTFAVAREVARLTKAGSLTSVAGGGDTVAALNAAGVADDLTYVSTAGGAFLEWLEGRDLPGVVALAKGFQPI